MERNHQYAGCLSSLWWRFFERARLLLWSCLCLIRAYDCAFGSGFGCVDVFWLVGADQIFIFRRCDAFSHHLHHAFARPSPRDRSIEPLDLAAHDDCSQTTIAGIISIQKVLKKSKGSLRWGTPSHQIAWFINAQFERGKTKTISLYVGSSFLVSRF